MRWKYESGGKPGREISALLDVSMGFSERFAICSLKNVPTIRSDTYCES
jgi:hypothetical protein